MKYAYGVIRLNFISYRAKQSRFYIEITNCSQGNLRDRVLVKTFSKSKPT